MRTSHRPAPAAPSLVSLAACLLALTAWGCASDPSQPDAATAADTSPGDTASADAAPPSTAPFCAGVGEAGCCDASVVKWCEGGVAVAIACASFGCGWDQSFYNCYATGAGPAEHPLACPGAVCVPTCNGACGVPDGCGGTCGCSALLGQTCRGGRCAAGATPTTCETIAHVGCCEGGTRRYCQAGAPRSEACAGGACGWNPDGWYACGASGADPSGVWPAACP